MSMIYLTFCPGGECLGDLVWLAIGIVICAVSLGLSLTIWTHLSKDQ